MSAASSESTFQKDAGVIERATKALPWGLVAAGTAIAATKSKEGAALYALTSLMYLGYAKDLACVRSKAQNKLGHHSHYLNSALYTTFSVATLATIAPVLMQCFARYSSYTALCSFAAYTIALGAFSKAPPLMVIFKEKFNANDAFQAFAIPAAFYTCAIALPSVLSPYVGGIPSRFLGGALFYCAQTMINQPKDHSLLDRMEQTFKDDKLAKKVAIFGIINAIRFSTSAIPSVVENGADIYSFAAITANNFIANSLSNEMMKRC